MCNLLVPVQDVAPRKSGATLITRMTRGKVFFVIPSVPCQGRLRFVRTLTDGAFKHEYRCWCHCGEIRNGEVESWMII